MLGFTHVCQVVRSLNSLTDKRDIFCFPLSGLSNPLPEKFMTYLDMNACALEIRRLQESQGKQSHSLESEVINFLWLLG